MKNIERTVNIPVTMTVIANAVWNENKCLWEVSVSQFATNYSAKTQEPIYEQSENSYEIAECDEFVIPYAILTDNGIDINKINNQLMKE